VPAMAVPRTIGTLLNPGNCFRALDGTFEDRGFGLGLGNAHVDGTILVWTDRASCSGIHAR